MRRVITYAIVMLFIACGQKPDEKEYAVARVFDQYLFLEDIKEAIPEDVKGNDSVLLANNYINRWVKERLLLKKAEINLSESIEEIDNLVEKYRNDLLVNKYKEQAVQQYLDTTVTTDQVEKFYQENKDIFKLNEELVQLKYIHFSNELLNPKEFESLFRSDKKADADSIKAKEMQLKSYNLNDSIWIRLDDVKQKLSSLEESDIDLILKKIRFLQKKDSLGVYLVAVKDVLKRNEIAPLSYIRPTINQMILHNRKLELIRKIEETLLEDAVNNKEFEIYEGK